MSAGYDKSKFLSFPAGFVDEFTCGICLNIYNEPMTTPCCRHSYCRQCIIQSLQMSSNPNTCPNDRKKLLSKDLMPADRTVTNILDKQEVYCDFKSYGCPQTVPLARLSSHLIQCGFDPNKAQDKCQQLLSEVTAAVDKIKPRVRRQEFEHMKERLTACQQEVRLMASQTAAQSVYVEPNTDAFKKKVMESAKSCVDNWEQIECNIAVKSVKKKVLKKCREAVRHSTDYNQLSQYLLDALNNQD
ncbi:unnamed protein product [Oppiella nova]|uniref:RING-type domain-containing protein n=1 Tax=Oppiella nova TaxID=334625 RepID=A0A7R9QSK2_9ACAR|nr:unnamed protein product [Oppiella nova]CAG2172858.1 unnamed protein product [Oppiella nova]